MVYYEKGLATKCNNMATTLLLFVKVCLIQPEKKLDKAKRLYKDALVIVEKYPEENIEHLMVSPSGLGSRS